MYCNTLNYFLFTEEQTVEVYYVPTTCYGYSFHISVYKSTESMKIHTWKVEILSFVETNSLTLSIEIDKQHAWIYAIYFDWHIIIQHTLVASKMTNIVECCVS